MKQITNFILGALAVFGVCTTASAEAIQTSTKDAPKYYLIKSNRFSRNIQAKASLSAENGVVNLAAKNATVTPSQLFRFEAGTTTGTYKIVNAEGFYLKSAKGNNDCAQTLTINTETTSSTSCDYEFKNATTDGSGLIKAQVASFLNPSGGENGDLKTWNDANDANSKWIFEEYTGSTDFSSYYEGLYDGLETKARAITESSDLGTIGYPDKSAVQAALNKATASKTQENILALYAAINNSPLNMPANGSFYRIINDNDEPIYLTNNNGSLALSKNATSGFNDVWKCEIKDGKYQFYNLAAGQYLKFLGTGGSAADCAQFATAADATSFVMSANKQINLGCLPLNTSDNRFLLVKNTVAFDRDGKTYNKTSSDFSSDYKFEKVSAVKEVTMNDGHDGKYYATWYNDKDKSLVVSGADTYIISNQKYDTNTIYNEDSQTIVLNNTNKSIKGTEGVILCGENAKAYIMESETPASYEGTSLLKGYGEDTTVSAEPPSGYYTLGLDENNGKVGLYFNLDANDDFEFFCPANHAYLEIFVPQNDGVAFNGFVFNFDNVTTGISTTINTTKVNGAFDILGRRVNGAKGLQIINGKKVIK